MFLRIARSYERRIRTGGVTRTGQARLQHQAIPRRRHRRKDAEKSVCGEDLQTPRHPLALGTCDVWGGIQGWNQDSVFPSELEAELMDYVNLRAAAVLTAIKSYYSDSSKKFLALVDLIMIPSDPQRIIAARASVVSSRERSAATDEEKNNKIVFSKTCTNCDLRQFDFDLIADRAVLPSRPP